MVATRHDQGTLSHRDLKRHGERTFARLPALRRLPDLQPGYSRAVTGFSVATGRPDSAASTPVHAHGCFCMVGGGTKGVVAYERNRHPAAPRCRQ